MSDSQNPSVSYIDEMIRAAFLYGDQLLTEDMLNSEVPDSDIEIDRAHIHRVVSKAYQKSGTKKKKPVKQLPVGTYWLTAAACLVLLLGIAIPVAFATVPSFRSAVMKLIIQYDETEQLVNLSFEKDETSEFEVPAQWIGEYFPSYIPEGFVMTEIYDFPASVTYVSEDGGEISFFELDENTAAGVGTEGAEVSYIDLIGTSALKLADDKGMSLTWSNDERWFMLDADGISEDEVNRIAVSVKKILK